MKLRCQIEVDEDLMENHHILNDLAHEDGSYKADNYGGSFDV